MILIPLLPAIVWAFSPSWFHPWMRAIAIVSLMVALVMFVRRLQRGWLLTRDGPARAAWQWQARWNATEFRQHLMNHLEEGGWTVLSSTLPDDDRVRITCERGRDRVVLLCVRPGIAPTPHDAALLAAERNGVEASTALLVNAPAEYAGLEEAESIGGRDTEGALL